MLPARKQPSRGMTMIELLVVIIIGSIIAAIAYPSFQGVIRKSRRSDAMTAVAQVMQAQERWRANNTAFYSGNLSSLPGAPAGAISANGHYSLELIAPPSGTPAVNAGNYYGVKATAQSDSQLSDTDCRVMQVIVDRGSVQYRSSTSAASDNSVSSDPCWTH